MEATVIATDDELFKLAGLQAVGLIQITVPDNLPPDRTFIIETPSGKRLPIQVPHDVRPGQTIEVNIPSSNEINPTGTYMLAMEKMGGRIIVESHLKESAARSAAKKLYCCLVLFVSNNGTLLEVSSGGIGFAHARIRRHVIKRHREEMRAQLPTTLAHQMKLLGLIHSIPMQTLLIALQVFIFGISVLPGDKWLLPTPSPKMLHALGASNWQPMRCAYEFLSTRPVYLLELRRVVAPMFLHANTLHLASNVLGQLQVGFKLETTYGRRSFLYLFLSCGIVGTLTSMAFTQGYGVGSSGAVFGLLGADLGRFYFVEREHVRRESDQEQLRLWWRNFLVELFAEQVMNTVLLGVSLGVFNIDHNAHVGGFVTGVILGAVINRKHNLYEDAYFLSNVELIKRSFADGARTAWNWLAKTLAPSHGTAEPDESEQDRRRRHPAMEVSYHTKTWLLSTLFVLVSVCLSRIFLSRVGMSVKRFERECAATLSWSYW